MLIKSFKGKEGRETITEAETIRIFCLGTHMG
jgi:hypothetical protein